MTRGNNLFIIMHWLFFLFTNVAIAVDRWLLLQHLFKNHAVFPQNWQLQFLLPLFLVGGTVFFPEMTKKTPPSLQLKKQPVTKIVCVYIFFYENC